MALIVDIATDKLGKLSRALKDRASINNATSEAVATLVRTHFRAYGADKKNKFGRPSTFWQRMTKSVRNEYTPTMSAVSMARPIAQKYFGGPIRPTGGRKFLTIPVSPESYGKSARSFHGLFVFRYADMGKNGQAYLAKSNRKVVLSTHSGPQKKEKITLLYLLKSFVVQKGDKSVLPTAAKIGAAMADAIKAYLKTKTA